MMGLFMSQPSPTAAEHRVEAERLIELARQLLNRPEEEMVVNYLDHAVQALHMIMEGQLPTPHDSSFGPVSCPSKAPAQGPDSPIPAPAHPAER